MIKISSLSLLEDQNLFYTFLKAKILLFLLDDQHLLYLLEDQGQLNILQEKNKLHLLQEHSHLRLHKDRSTCTSMWKRYSRRKERIYLHICDLFAEGVYGKWKGVWEGGGGVWLPHGWNTSPFICRYMPLRLQHPPCSLSPMSQHFRIRTVFNVQFHPASSFLKPNFTAVWNVRLHPEYLQDKESSYQCCRLAESSAAVKMVNSRPICGGILVVCTQTGPI